MLIAVNYHYVRPSFDQRYPCIHGSTPSQFEEQLKVLGEAAEFVSGHQVRDAVAGANGLPERCFLITFDDGLREQYDHAWPVLKKLGIPAVFFVNTRANVENVVLSVHKIHLLRSILSPSAFLDLLRRFANGSVTLDADANEAAAIAHYRYDTPENAKVKYLLNFALPLAERDRLIDLCFEEVFPGREAEISRSLYMSEEQIRELGVAECIGSHGHDHLPLGLIDETEAQTSIEDSASYLEQWTGYRPFALSYPYGSKAASSDAVARIASEAGFQYAFTMERAGNEQENFAHPLQMARFASNDLPGGTSPVSAGVEDLFDNVPAGSWWKEA